MEISLILGVLIGIVLGLTGAGGGILAVPALVFGMGWSMQQAAPVALIAVAGSAALGAVQGLRQGLVRYKAAVVMVLCGLPVTKAGVALAHLLPQRWLLGLFAAVVLLVAARLIRQTMRAVGPKTGEHALARTDPATGRFLWTWRSGLLFAGVGAVAGFLTGLLGVAGGFVIVPALRRYTPLSMHSIVATSLLVIALVGGGGIVGAVTHGVELPWPATLLFAVATALGMGVGRLVAPRLSETLVQRGFALVLLVAAASLIAKAVAGS